jgi:hypothetical protein
MWKMIFFSLCILLLFSTISTLPTPAVVYSAVIHNVQGSPVECSIGWRTPSNNKLQKQSIEVQQNKYYTVNQKLFDMGTWTARGIITRIRCGDLVLRAPFPNVKKIEENWEFRVEPDAIVSVGSSSQTSTAPIKTSTIRPAFVNN